MDKDKEKLLDELILTGKSRKNVKIGEVTFTISTLPAGVISEITPATAATDPSFIEKFAKDIRFKILANAIEKVNDIPFEDVVASVKGDDVLQKKVNLLKKLDETVILVLLAEYNALTTKQQELLSDNTALKASLKNV